MFKFIARPEDIVQYDVRLDKDLAKLPKHILKKFKIWVQLVNNYGINEARKTPGFHDEPLHAGRAGQRSIR